MTERIVYWINIVLILIWCNTFLCDQIFRYTNQSDFMYTRGATQYFDCSIKEGVIDKFRMTWFRDGALMSSYQRNPQEEYLNNNQLMKISKFKSRDSGQYSCNIYVKNGGKIERKFNIPPTKIPHISKARKSYIRAFEGESVRLKCLVSRHYTRTYKWFHDALEINAEYKGVKIREYKFLRIKSVEIDDSGFYTCSVANDIGIQEITYHLQVKARGNFSKETGDSRPVIQYPEVTLIDIVGNDMGIDCSVSGAKPITITWLKNDIPLSKQPRAYGDYELYENNQWLWLRNILPKDKGFYTCIATNNYGSVNHTFQVDPQERNPSPPLFSGKKSGKKIIEAAVGENKTVVAFVIAFGSSHIQLLHHCYTTVNETYSNVTTRVLLKVMDTPRKYFLIDDKSNTHAVKSRLEFYFLNISEKDYGTYSVMAGNIVGYDAYQFSIVRKKTNNPVEKRKKKSSWLSSKAFMALIITIAILVLTVPILMLIWCRRSKKNVNNNGDIFTAKPNITLNLMNKNEPFTSLKECSTGRIVHFSSGRLSSCQTEKEYIYQPLPVDPEWEVPLENIEFKGLLGEGAFGRVMLGTVHALPCHVAPLTVAVKTLKDDATESELKDLLSEMQVMKMIGKHENIVNLLGVSTQQGEICMVIEYCRFGNLRTYLKKRRPVLPPGIPPIEVLTLRHLTSFCLQVAKGMNYLALQKCIHRDIAARNVLVAEDHVVKIADFGLARDIHVTDYYRKCTDGRLPVKWMAMEALFDRVYTTQSDIWSFGILAWEIVTFGGSPYPGIPLERLFDLLKQGYRMEKPINCTDDMYALMLNCWKEIPTRRPTFSEIIDHLQIMLNEMNEEYLELQPPIIQPYTTESISSQLTDSTSNCSRHSSSSVFDEKLDEIEVNIKKSESVALLPQVSEFHTKL